MLSDPNAALLRLAEVLESLRVDYLVAGSVASSAYGIQRATADIDVVADLQLEHAEPLAAALAGEFYADEGAIRAAISTRTSFNVIRLATMDKIDVFLTQKTPWSREEVRHRVSMRIDPANPTRTTFFASPEDTILHKLKWFRAGGGVSERQWSDVLGVMRVQAANLDTGYMRQWAPELEVSDLLERAVAESGLPKR